ncbi:type II CRISPR RNA-guided endonuclease Cas9 [Companilactobacillus furfuricola]|uniref:type II CRISPR RNA-guided endonuclease Cas9 n=1 Tax=Companilactobacillus furfuricola TaxID=1462575 RepID=UPI00248228CD|nr:type II CRISPR RNA-guided endonuclease Cas9 [Companilactobacillus furfuricola]
MTRDISLGLDMGVSSVGYSVIDIHTGEIFESGVRLFNATIAEGNSERRDFRGSRRLTGRNTERRKETAKLFFKCGLLNQFDLSEYYKPFDNNQNSYQIRVDGLHKKISKLEIAEALYHIVKRRGISYELNDDEETNKKGSNYQNGLLVNTKELATMTPAEIQLERLKKYSAVRGSIDIEIDNKKTTLLNVFPTKDFVSEAKRIIANQRQFYPECLTENFEEKYLEILQRKREYFVGPGSEKSRTDYGIYKEDGRTLDNLFEELIGRCSVYKDQLRAPAASYTAQYFNLLNDLNNLRILSNEDQKLTYEQKEKIINAVLSSTTKKINLIKIIKKF